MIRIRDSERDLGLLLAVLAQQLCLIEAKSRNPSLDNPDRVSVCSGEIAGRCGQTRNSNRLVLLRELAQHGVDHAGGEAMTRDFGQGDALVDGSVDGNALEKKNLKGCQAKRDAYLGIELGGRACEQQFNARIQQDAPAHDPHHQRGGKVPVGERQRIDAWRTKQLVSMSRALFQLKQNGRGNFPRGRNGEGSSWLSFVPAVWSAFGPVFGPVFGFGHLLPQPGVWQERVAAHKFGSGDAAFAFELHLFEFEPTVRSAGDKQLFVFGVK